MANLGFLKDFKKNIEKLNTVNVGAVQPQIWWSTGNYALNKALSGSYKRGIPVGRISLFCGPSGSGKSYISNNIMCQAQKDGAHLVVLDTENSLDIEYMTKIGVDVSEDKMTYIQVGTIEDVNAICSELFNNYEKEYGRNNPDAPKMLMVLDSIAMLSTTTEFDNYDKSGEIKADQGIRAKRTKSMLRMILSRISRLPIAFIATDHVYPADIMAGDGAWAITNSTKFFPSIIGIVTKLKLKEDAEVVGVRMRFETYKSRFAKIGTKVELEVPYDSGMSAFSGLLDMLEADGVVTKAGAWYSANINGEDLKFQKKGLDESLVNKLLHHPKVLATENDISEDDVSELISDEQ